MEYEACGHYIVVELESLGKEQKSEGGIVIAKTSEAYRREQKGTCLAVVKDIGKNAWQGHTDPYGDFEPWCKVGDKVMIAQYAGQAFPLFDHLSPERQEEVERLRLITDEDVLARIKE